MVQTRFQRRSNDNFKDSPQDNIENVPQVPQQQTQSPQQPQSIPSLTRNASREVLIEVPYGGVDKIGMLLEQLNDDECSTLDNIRERWWPSVRSRLKGMPRHLPKQKDTRPTLVLDVDETLLHTFIRQSKIPNDPDYVVYDENNEHILMAGMLRPGVSEFLQWAAQHFELVMWTAGDDQYARLAVELLDPERTLFEHILTRRVCIDLHFTMPHEVLHVKDLCALGRDLSRTFMVDNNPHTAALNLSNLIPIKPYLGDGDDRELIQLRAFLNSMLARVEYCDVRLILHREFDLKRELRERVRNWRKSVKKDVLQEQ